MKKLQIGLVIEGSSTSSTLLRLHGLAAELGPIKSSSLQVARRVSNFLKGGHAVHSYSDLSSSRTILISVPDASVERVVHDLSSSEFNWRGHSFVLCETWLSTKVLEPLKDLGASIASAVMLPMEPPATFAIEGDSVAARQLRRVLERAGAHTIELRPDSKHLLFAAAILCGALPIPLLLMAQKVLREGGVSGLQLSALIAGMSEEMLAGVLKGGRGAWGGPLAELPEPSQQVYWNQLNGSHPELAGALRTLVEWGGTYMEKR